EEDEMLPLPEFLREYSLMRKQHVSNFHIQSNLLLDFSDHGILHRLANFDVSAWEGVLVKPLVRFRQEYLSFLVDYQRAHGGFRVHLALSSLVISQCRHSSHLICVYA